MSPVDCSSRRNDQHGGSPAGKNGIYFSGIESEGGSFSIGLYEMFPGGFWLVDKNGKSGTGWNRAASTCQKIYSRKESHDMFSVIRENRDRSITRLMTYGSLEAMIVASQLEKNKVSYSEQSAILAVALDDGEYVEIIL